MKSLRTFAVLAVACLAILPARAEEWTPEPGFVSLYNGKDLTGWGYRDKEQKILETFDGKAEASDGRYTAKPGILVVNAHDTAKGPRIRQLWTTREFPKNFILKIEFRAAVNADSGIFTAPTTTSRRP